MLVTKKYFLRKNISLALLLSIWGVSLPISATGYIDKGPLNIENSDTEKSIGIEGHLGENFYYEGGILKINPNAREAYAIKCNDDFKIKINAKDFNYSTDKIASQLNGVAGTKDVVIEGNIWTESKENPDEEADEQYLTGEVNLGLTTKNSHWHGTHVSDQVAKDYTGTLNLWIQNGAKWTNESIGTEKKGSSSLLMGERSTWINALYGGASTDKKGIIHQKNKRDFCVREYRGHLNVIYDRDKNNPTEVLGGGIIIQQAYDMGGAHNPSTIDLFTDREGLDLTDNRVVERTLTNLANKIAYKMFGGGGVGGGFSGNLAGSIYITDGLLGSVLKAGDLEWTSSSANYKPKVVPTPPVVKPKTKFTSIITGGNDQEYIDNNIKKANGLYKFTEDTTITSSTGSFAGADMIVDVDSHGEGVNIDAQDKTLTFQGRKKNYNIFVKGEKNKNFSIKANKLLIEAENKDANLLVAFMNSSGKVEGNTEIKLLGSKNTMFIECFRGLKGSDTWNINGNFSFIGEGQQVSFFDFEHGGNLNVAGNLSLSLTGHGQNVRGIHASEGNVVIGGDLTVLGRGKADSWGIDNTTSNIQKSATNTIGIYAGGTAWGGGSTSIQIKGNTKLTSAGSGVAALKGGTVNFGGDVDIKIKNDPNVTNYSLFSGGGHVFANVNSTTLKPMDKKVNLVGNVATLTMREISSTPKALTSTLYLALTTEDSSWQGAFVSDFEKDHIVSGSKAEGHLYLQNNALWQHEIRGKLQTKPGYFQGSRVSAFYGGKDVNSFGIIYQKDVKPIHLDNYEGYTTIFYKHDKNQKSTVDKNGYMILGGNTIIEKAKENSHILLVTDDEGLNLKSTKANDTNCLHGTLNNLAHKLYYLAHQTGEQNLTAKVGVVENLLTPSTVKTITIETKKYKVPESKTQFGVTFQSNGQGEHTYPPNSVTPSPTPPNPPPTPVPTPKPPATPDSLQITGDENKDTKYEKDGVLDKNKAGIYNLKASENNIKLEGKAGIVGEKDIEVRGKDKRLSIENINTTTDEKQYGIQSDEKHKMHIDVQKLSITVENNKNTETAGIHAGKMGLTDKSEVHIQGAVDINATGKNNVHGIHAQAKKQVTINGPLKIKTNATQGNFVTGIYTENKDTKVEVEKDVDIKIKGTGILATDNSEINIKGGGNVAIEENDKSDQYAIKVAKSTVKFHYVDKGENLVEKDVNIKGNIGVLSEMGRANTSDTTELYLGLNTENSTFRGVAYNEFSENNKEGGKIHLHLGNKATWIHEKVGKTNANFKASHIYELTGNDKASIIDQRAEENIYIENISGKHQIKMQHKNKGTQKEDYTVGNIYLKNANKGSEITLITQNTLSVNLEDKEEAYNFFNTLANKLFYTGEKENMKGKVIIEDRLLDPVKAMRNITFDQDKNGQGMIKKENEPNQPNKPNKPNKPDKPPVKPQMETGDYETTVMKGTRTTMLSASLFWTNHNNDALRRLGDLRLAKEESGIWTKYQGGETNFDGEDNSGKEVNISQKYNLLQVGYDKKIGDFTLGAVLDHGKASDTYFGKGDILLNKDKEDVLTGTGKIHMTGLALYANRTQKDGRYFDFIGKIGQVKSDYDVNTSLNTDSIHGSYKTLAYSLSGEYGKRIYQKDGFYYEPSIELTISKVGDKDYFVYSTKGTRLDIHQKGMQSTVGRLGIGFGRESARGHYFVKLALAHEFSGDIKTDFYIEKTKERKEIKLNLSDTWFDLELGTSYKMSDSSYFYGTFTKNFGAKLDNKWRLDAGLRFAL